MAKRIRDSITPGTMKSAAPPVLEGVDAGDVARERSGMAPDQWNAAIRFQCAVRDRLARPVSLAEALNFGRQLFAAGNEKINMLKSVETMQDQFDEARELEQQAKTAATEAAKKNAGKRNG